MHIAEVLAAIRQQALSEQEKGRRFEKLMQAWFLASPVYKTEQKKLRRAIVVFITIIPIKSTLRALL